MVTESVMLNIVVKLIPVCKVYFCGMVIHMDNRWIILHGIYSQILNLNCLVILFGPHLLWPWPSLVAYTVAALDLVLSSEAFSYYQFAMRDGNRYPKSKYQAGFTRQQGGSQQEGGSHSTCGYLLGKIGMVGMGVNVYYPYPSIRG